MIVQKQRDYLDFIYREYHLFCDLAAGRWRHRPEVLAGIIMRESEGGLSKQLVDDGTLANLADDTGDKGHGHGLLQIDDRSFPEFCKGEDWKDSKANIDMGACVLASKRAYLKRELLGFGMTDEEIERASIAAYNAGEGRVLRTIKSGQDPDSVTAHGDYSRCVLEFADEYLQIVGRQEKTLHQA